MGGQTDLGVRARRGRAPPTNLPVIRDPLIGREHEVAAASALLLREDVGLVTLTGAGGSGKTRLALHVGSQVLDAFDDGVWLVSLASIRDPALVLYAISQALDLQGPGGPAAEAALYEHLRHRDLLLILDNFEHVQGAAPRVGELLREAPGLTVLVTSRSPLHLSDEHELTVPPLSLPDRHASVVPAMLLSHGAIELFVRRARAVVPNLSLVPEHAKETVEICHRLDGLPLALELAAARLRLLSTEAMLARLERRLPLLVGGARDLPNRQQTLRATIGWSHDLLNEDQRRLFRRLAVFEGGFTLDAVESVAGGMLDAGGDEPPSPPPIIQDPPPTTLDLVESLIEQNLIVRQTSEGEPRYRMLETIREYALERLDAAGELPATRRRHADYVLALAERIEPTLTTPAQVAGLARLEAEHDNARAVFRWVQGEVERAAPGGVRAREAATVGLRLGAALWWFWFLRGHVAEGCARLETALGWPSSVRPHDRVRPLYSAGHLNLRLADFARSERWLNESRSLAATLGDRHGLACSDLLLSLRATMMRRYTEARSLAETALATWRDLDEQWYIALALYSLGMNTWQMGELESAITILDEGLAVSRRVGDGFGVATTLHFLGFATRQAGNLRRAEECHQEALVLGRSLGSRSTMAFALHGLGQVAATRGDLAGAGDLFLQSVTLRLEIADHANVALDLEALARVALARDDPAGATRLIGSAVALRQRIGVSPPAVSQAEVETSLATARARLGDQAFDAAWDGGTRLSPSDAIASTPAVGPVREGEPRLASRSTTDQAATLSAREREVAALIARGMTNAAIAATLVISQRTVHRHVGNILDKLDLRSRAQVAVWAVERGLLPPPAE